MHCPMCGGKCGSLMLLEVYGTSPRAMDRAARWWFRWSVHWCDHGVTCSAVWNALQGAWLACMCSSIRSPSGWVGVRHVFWHIANEGSSHYLDTWYLVSPWGLAALVWPISLVRSTGAAGTSNTLPAARLMKVTEDGRPTNVMKGS